MTCKTCQGEGIITELTETVAVWYSTDGKVYTEGKTICPTCDGRESQEGKPAK